MSRELLKVVQSVRESDDRYPKRDTMIYGDGVSEEGPQCDSGEEPCPLVARQVGIPGAKSKGRKNTLRLEERRRRERRAFELATHGRGLTRVGRAFI